MSISGGIVFEGSTVFDAPAAAYRYKIALKDSKMSFWMEDCASERQWFQGNMDEGVYVTAENAIAGASITDYLKCFHEALSCALDGPSDFRRKLSVLKGDILEVQLSLMLRLFHTSWEAKFFFQLNPVSIERIDILESKLRDQEDTLKKINVLESKLRDQEEQLAKLHTSTSTVVEFKGTQTVPGISHILRVSWTGNGSLDIVSNAHTGAIKVNRPGVYLIEAAVKCDYEENDDDDDDDEEKLFASLLKNGECLREDFFTEERSIASLIATMRLKDGDELMVTSTCTLDGISTLFITRLAD